MKEQNMMESILSNKKCSDCDGLLQLTGMVDYTDSDISINYASSETDTLIWEWECSFCGTNGGIGFENLGSETIRFYTRDKKWL